APGPVAERFHRAAVQAHERADHGEADAQAALGPIEGARLLHEQIEARARSSRLIPIPSSPMVTTASLPSVAEAIEMRPPASVYLAALLMMLAKTWMRRVGSASRGSGARAGVTESWWRFSARTGRLTSTAWASKAASSTRSVRSWIFPWLTRETS